VLFEGLQINPTVVLGTLLVLAGNLFVLRSPAPKSGSCVPRVAEEPA